VPNERLGYVGISMETSESVAPRPFFSQLLIVFDVHSTHTRRPPDRRTRSGTSKSTEGASSSSSRSGQGHWLLAPVPRPTSGGTHHVPEMGGACSVEPCLWTGGRQAGAIFDFRGAWNKRPISISISGGGAAGASPPPPLGCDGG
jgi:hypothetical protein